MHAVTTIPHLEQLAQIQVILINGAPSDAPAIEQLEIKRADGAKEPGRLGMQLFKDDDVTTGPGVEVSLLFDKTDSEDQVQVQIHENSRARIGSFWAYVGRFLVSGWGSFDTRTQEVRLGKRATEFYVEVEEDGSVDLKVLRGEVEVEQVADNPPPEEYSHARPPYEKVTALQGLQVKKGQRPTPARKLETDEVDRIITKTNKLMLASLALTTPSNVIPTSYILTAEIANDPQRKKAAADSAFVAARRAATLTPTPDNVNALADAFKDLGAGKRAAKEYERAAGDNAKLNQSVKFLSSQAEAYRLAGNLKKADDISKEAVRLSETDPSTKAEDKQLARNVRGNVVYDLAVQLVGKNKWREAGRYFQQSKSLYTSAKEQAPSSAIRQIAEYNETIAFRAINGGGGSLLGAKLDFDGTYRGLVRFPGAKLNGQATLVISGNRFSLITCDRTIAASMIQSEKATGGGYLINLVLDASTPIKKISLKATLPERNRIELTSAPGERNNFSFSTSLKQVPPPCPGVRGLR